MHGDTLRDKALQQLQLRWRQILALINEQDWKSAGNAQRDVFVRGKNTT
jgi:hypothetical protein